MSKKPMSRLEEYMALVVTLRARVVALEATLQAYCDSGPNGYWAEKFFALLTPSENQGEMRDGRVQSISGPIHEAFKDGFKGESDANRCFVCGGELGADGKCSQHDAGSPWNTLRKGESA